LVEHLLPFRRRIDFGFHPGKADGAIAGLLLLRFGVDDAVSMRRARPAALAFIEDLRAIEGQREILDILDESLFFALLHFVRVNGRTLPGDGAGETLNRLRKVINVSLTRSERTHGGGAGGERDNAVLDTVKVDLDFNRLFFLLALVLAGLFFSLSSSCI